MILWKSLFEAGHLGWVALVSILSVVLYIGGFVLAFFPSTSPESDRNVWRALPLNAAMLTVAWGLWIYTLSFGPSMGTMPADNQQPPPMISMQEMMVIGDAEKDETHLYGRGGLIGDMSFLAMDQMIPQIDGPRSIFATRRPNHHLPLLLEFCFRWSGFMIVVLPLTLLWSRSLSGVRLGLLTVLWSTLVFAPVAHALSGDGWLEKFGTIDFSLGLILLSSGFAALIGIRKPDESGLSVDEKSTAGGVLLMWTGLSLHVSAYAFHADGRAVIALVNMLIGTACGILVWSFCNSFLWKKPFTENTAAGTLAGLSAIAPAAGFMAPQSALMLGCSAVVISNIIFRAMARRDPQNLSRQLFSSLGVGSLMGLLGTGVFATSGVAGLRWDGREILGVIQGNPHQLAAQAIAIASAAAWAILVTWLLIRILSLGLGRAASRT